MVKKIAFVVATKDRPSDLRRMLASVSEQSCRPSQIVIVDASAEPVKRIMGEFSNLNIIYIYQTMPSASAQRNVGIRAVDENVDLIGFLDDDIILESSAVEAMMRFWNEAPKDVCGCGFNLKNFEPSGNEGMKYSFLAQWLGLYSKEPGIITKSGWQTMIGTVNRDMYVQWLPSTASVWKKKLFESFTFDEYFEGYSYLEDLDFSFSVSSKCKLAVVADAGFYHYPSSSGRISAYQFGKIEVRNRLYIVRKHHLSLLRCYAGILIRLLLTLGLTVRTGESGYLYRAFGNCTGMIQSIFR